MTSSHEIYDDSSYLPQYGFGKTLDFAKLVERNQFLFRVYTPKERSPFFDDTEPLFIAPRFDERYRNTTPGGLQEWEAGGRTAVANATYQDIARHLNWTTRSSSPYISTSFSPIWSIWEAVRRYHHGVKQDVEIAIIDVRAVSDRAITAAYLLSKASSQERHEAHWKWFRFSQESQSVLVYGAIPGTAVLASVPIVELLRKLPSYFVKDYIGQSNRFDCLAWDHTERKPNFRSFCRDMSNRFLQLSPEEKLQDATTGSVELAIGFLRPWFHQAVEDEYEIATSKLCMLAYTISQWPCQWWILEHPEIWDLTSGMVSAITEELLEKNKARPRNVAYLQKEVDKLEHTSTAYEDKSRLRYVRFQDVKHHKPSSGEKITEESVWSARAIRPTSHLPTPDASPGRCSDKVQAILPGSPTLAEKSASARSLLPILSSLSAPAAQVIDHSHTSPSSGTVDATQIPLPSSPLPGTVDATQIPLPPSPLAEDRPSLKSVPSLLPALPITPVSSPTRKSSQFLIELKKLIMPPEGDVPSPSSSISSSSTRLFTRTTDSQDDESTTPSTPIEKITYRLLPSPHVTPKDMHSKDVQEPEQDKAPLPQIDVDAAIVLDGMDLLDDYEWVSDEEAEWPYSPVQKIPIFVETASYLATGFLVGAFITLCLFSSHKRTIIMNVYEV